MQAGAGPLEGLRVLDASTYFAAPQLAAHLGDLGAEVVKVEPPSGDPLRAMGARGAGGASLLWATVGRNKKSVTLDLRQERGRELLRELCARADVLVENLPAATLERWNLRFEDLRARNPRLVMVSVSCYGRSGPYRDRPGNGTLAEAFAGLTAQTGEVDGPPMLTSLAVGDALAAMAGVAAVLAACYHRDARGGAGQHVDVSLYEPVLQLLAPRVAEWAHTGETPRRSGNRIPGSDPRNLYRTRDGAWLAVSAVTDPRVARILALLGRDTPEDRTRFGTAPARREHGDALDTLLAAWVAERDAAEVLRTLLGEDIPVAPVNELGALLDDPHVAARGNLVRVPDERLGEVTLLASFVRLGETPARVRSTGPALGAHTAQVLGGWLGLGPAELEALARAGITRS